MIRTRREYIEARNAVGQLEREIPREKARWLDQGFDPQDADEMVQPARLRLAELRDEITLYERIQAGDLSMFSDFEDYGKAMIAARIAQGMTQRELADRLGVHESQVSRDERNEYHGIGTERLAQLFSVLGMEYRGAFSLNRAEAVPIIPFRPVVRVQEPFVFRRAAAVELHPDELHPV